jgi:aspartate racemase
VRIMFMNAINPIVSIGPVDTIGIIGGIGPESTVEYYKLIIRQYRQKWQDGSYPSIIINSINMTKMLDLVGAGKTADLTAYLLDEIHRLARAGADFGLLASNTPHVVFDELSAKSPIPLLSIVEAACRAAKIMGLKRVGLFGTRFTMTGRFYPDTFEKEGIALVVPNIEEQTYIHDKYMNELVNGIVLEETRTGLLSIADRLKGDEHIDGLLLGGTELPLILRDTDNYDIPLLDTTRIHVEAAVAKLLKDKQSDGK